jgi:hypothetical protein
MGLFWFSISYFVLSVLSGALLGLPLYWLVTDILNFSLVAEMGIVALLAVSIMAGLLTVSFRMLNGVAELRPVSAAVLVFLLSIVGIVISLVIGGVFNFLLGFASVYWMNIGAVVMQLLVENFGFRGAALLPLFCPSLSTIISAAVLAALFGLPLARMANGIRFAEAWGHQGGKRRTLFWQCGVGVLGCWAIWTTLSLIVYILFVEPALAGSPLFDFDVDFEQLAFPQPTMLELSYIFGMNLMFLTLSMGPVAYCADQIRKRSG